MSNLAVIELNDKELKLLIYKTSNGRYSLTHSASQPLRLGQEIMEEELLRPKTKNDLLEVLKIYRKLIETFKASKIIAFATNILLKARNYHGFIEEIYNNTGISFSVFDEEDIIKNVYGSTINSIDYSKGYLINIGSYSTHFIKYNRRTILASHVIGYGAMNIMTDPSGKPRSFDEMEKLIEDEVRGLDFLPSAEEESMFVGTGNSFLSFGHIAKKISRYPLDLDNNYVVSQEVMEQTVNFIKGIDLDRLKKIKGIAESEAECIGGGLAIIRGFYKALGAKEVTVSTANVIDGLVHSQIALPSQEKFNDLLANSVDSYCEFMPEDHAINIHVYTMAVILFKQLKVMHKLPRFYIKPLRIAAQLYDSGRVINYNDYAKHGFHTILNSGLVGVSHRELLLAAFICLCQDLDNFSLAEWMKYKDIVTEEDLDAIRKLGVIVKLAVALNASKKPLITDIICDILGDSIIMKTVVEGDVTFEIMEGMKVADDYRKVFKKSLQII